MKKSKTGYFYQIPVLIAEDKNLPNAAKWLYGLLTTLVDKHGYCFASNKWLGKKMNVRPEYISTMLVKLEDKKWIIIENKQTKWRRVLLRFSKSTLKKSQKYFKEKLKVKSDSNTKKMPNDWVNQDGVNGPSIKESIKDSKKVNKKNNISLRLYDYYVLRFKKNPNRYKPLPSKLKKIETRLKSYTAKEIAQAIKNASEDDFYSGKSKDWHADLVWICKNDENLEKMLNLKPRKQKTIEEEFEVIK